MGEPAYEIDFEQLVRACGVKRVQTIDPNNKDALKSAMAEEVAAAEPSVIIVRRKCLLKR